MLSNILILLNILGSGEDEDLLFDDDDNHEDLIRLMEHDSDLENDDTGSDSTTSSQGIDRWWKKKLKERKNNTILHYLYVFSSLYIRKTRTKCQNTQINIINWFVWYIRGPQIVMIFDQDESVLFED